MKDTSKNVGNVSMYYKAVSALKNREAPKKWDPRTLFPGLSDLEIGEKVAAYFNAISEEFPPLDINNIPSGEHVEYAPLKRYEVAAALKAFKKPKSCVQGDIPPRLVTEYSDILAIPLTDLYNQIIRESEWPDLWKKETVIIIPKTSNPEGLSECRNLSCTPLLSKVLESFILKRLKEETRFSQSQYGDSRDVESITSW